jgi:site-specific recombinase XerD
MQRALDIGTDKIKKYIAERQREDAANASINRELSALKWMFKLAIESGRSRFGPHIPMLEENNARQGFVDHGVFLALRDRLPDYLKDPITFLYLSGWRLGEMKALEWRDVDIAGKVVRLRPEVSKNRTAGSCRYRENSSRLLNARRHSAASIVHSCSTSTARRSVISSDHGRPRARRRVSGKS